MPGLHICPLLLENLHRQPDPQLRLVAVVHEPGLSLTLIILVTPPAFSSQTLLEAKLKVFLAMATLDPAPVLRPRAHPLFRLQLHPSRPSVLYVCVYAPFLSSEGQTEAGTPDKEASKQPESNDGTTSS